MTKGMAEKITAIVSVLVVFVGLVSWQPLIAVVIFGVPLFIMFILGIKGSGASRSYVAAFNPSGKFMVVFSLFAFALLMLPIFFHLWLLGHYEWSWGERLGITTGIYILLPGVIGGVGFLVGNYRVSDCKGLVRSYVAKILEEAIEERNVKKIKHWRMLRGSLNSLLNDVDYHVVDNADPEVIKMLAEGDAKVGERFLEHYFQDKSGFRGKHERWTTVMASSTPVYIMNTQGQTALIIAAEDGWPMGVYGLIRNGADINAQDNDGMTALMMLAKYHGGSKLIKEFCHDFGPDITLISRENKTALDYLDEYYEKNEWSSEAIENSGIRRVLISANQ